MYRSPDENAFISLKGGTLLIVTGILIQFVEALLLQKYLGKSMLEHQFLFGTIPFSIGVFSVARLLGASRLPRISRWSREHSLTVYIIHPYFIELSWKIFALCGIHGIARDILVVPVVFAISLMLSIAILRLFPGIAKLISGDLTGLIRSGHPIDGKSTKTR